MTKEELIKTLKNLQKYPDPEVVHSEADEALIEYINVPEITKAYNKLKKWYA